jgi:parallel beta-helix repeat protein
MVYLNGSFQINVSKGTQFYNATELTPDTAYTIGTHTVDTSGNINQTLVNHTVSLSSNNIYVPDDYPTIQAAVDVASTGNTIIVRNGMYTENVDVNKRVTIHSENGAGASIVHAANPKDHVFEVTANYVNISGFTVKGATEWVAGICLENVDHCCVINNYVSNNYNGITLKNSSGNMIRNNNVNSNELRGIDAEYSSNNNIIKNNSVSSNKYGIDIRTSCNINIITGNDVNSNTKAGIVIDSCNNNVITNNTACHNKGRGIEISSSSNNIISGNIASFNERDGILVDESPSNTITNNTVNSNSNRGISLWDSSNNYIYLNNLKSNDYNADLHNSNNIWNTPSQITYIYNGSRYTNYLGNYWGDYKKKYPDAEEIGGCGIWDTAHKIDSENSDDYPLIDEFEDYRVVPQGIVTIGYSIIIAGRRDDDLAHSAINLSANNAYKILLKRGFTREHIFYLNPRIEQGANDDGALDVDRISSVTNISYAINTWAQGNVSVNTPLFIYMVGHGRNDTYIVNGAKDTLTASDLDNYLDQLTDTTGCHDITLVYDACRSGSFIDNLSCNGTIIVTSVDSDTEAQYHVGGVVFSEVFFKSISGGKTIGEAFEFASNYFKDLEPYNITPLLDDNGDNVGHAIPLLGTGDGLLAASKYIGTQRGALGIAPTITSAIQNQKVVVNTTITIWAVVDADYPIENVYTNVIEPNFSLSPVNDTLIEINLTTLHLEDLYCDGNYTASFTPPELGNYSLILHATDKEGNMASPKQCVITVVSSPENVIFDTGEEIYTYQCKRTDGHSEFGNIWNLNWKGADAYLNGYVEDWHNSPFNEIFVLYKNKTCNYTTNMGSYPQVIHEGNKDVLGEKIASSDFTDANGYSYNNGILAIRLDGV